MHSLGDVDIDEFVGGMREMGLELDDDQFEKLYKDIDLDGDGQLTLKEFTTAAKQALVQAREIERAQEALKRAQAESAVNLTDEDRDKVKPVYFGTTSNAQHSEPKAQRPTLNIR